MIRTKRNIIVYKHYINCTISVNIYRKFLLKRGIEAYQQFCMSKSTSQTKCVISLNSIDII